MSNKKNKGVFAKLYILLFFIPVFIVGLLFIILLAFELAYIDRIYPRISISGLDIGNKTRQKAKEILLRKVNLNKPIQIVLIGPTQVWKINVDSLSLSYQIDDSVHLAYQAGRNKDFFSNWQERKTAWFQGIDLSLSFQITPQILEEQVNEISRSIFIPSIEPQIKLLDETQANGSTRILVETGKEGQEVDKEKLLALIYDQLAFLKNKPILIPVQRTSPRLNDQQIASTKNRAENLLGKTLKLKLEDQNFVLSEKELLNFISFDGKYDEEKIENYLDNLVSSLNRLPQNAAFQFVPGSKPGEKGKVSLFRPGKEGIRINKEKLHGQLSEALSILENSNDKEILITISFDTVQPKIRTADINNLGINELLGKGVSYFRGSASSRIHNINLASARLNGILVAPGETFSFNDSLGEVSKATGFKEAYVIKEGKTILDDGGGVCQVSTTLFRAVLNAGLPIEERHAHSYRVSYYEQGPVLSSTGQGPNSSTPGQIGMDATVFPPSVDFKFTNDTPAYILIQTNADLINNTLTFELYGTSDRRITTIGPSRAWNRTPPPPDSYQDDPTLPKGTIKQTEKSIWGIKAAFDWKVTNNGKTLQERTFYSNYRPWQAVYLRGTR